MRRLSLVTEDGSWRCPRVRTARTYWQRLRGLLGRPPLEHDEALLLIPGGSIHTLGMRYAIDVVHLDAAWRVVRVHHAVNICRIALAPGGTCCTLELSAGVAAGLGPGDRLIPTEIPENPCGIDMPCSGSSSPRC
jgi:uncharacterized membrane protein (UPF0127 family)